MKKLIKGFILGLLAGSIVLSSLTVLGKSVSSSKNIEPVKIKTRAIKLKNTSIDVNLKVPVLSSNSNLKGIFRLNRLFDKDAQDLKKLYVSQAKAALRESKKSPIYHFNPYQVYTDYKVRYNKNGLISLTVMHYIYTGGANGLETQAGYTCWLKDGKLLGLSDLMSPNFNYKAAISRVVLKQMKQNKANYFPEAITGFKPIKANQSYYISKNNVVVFYGPFEIAPHSSGIPEFKIPFSLLKLRSNLKVY